MTKSSFVRSLRDSVGGHAIFRLGIRNRLVVLLLGFGLVPAFTMFSMLLMQADGIKALLDARVQSTAEQVNNVIDRNLSERYSDAQVFSMNVAAQDEWNWNRASAENPLVQAMNSYMTSSGIYKLMLVLDPTGKAVAVNSVDAAGKLLDTESILGQEFGAAPWFARAAKGEFLQGRNGLTGTSVEQPADIAVVAKMYGGDGYVIPFSAEKPASSFGARKRSVRRTKSSFGAKRSPSRFGSFSSSRAQSRQRRTASRRRSAGGGASRLRVYTRPKRPSLVSAKKSEA